MIKELVAEARRKAAELELSAEADSATVKLLRDLADALEACDEA